MQAPPASPTEVRRLVDAEIDAFLGRARGGYDAEAHPLLEEIRRVVGAGGKRLRPVFCYWGHVAAGGYARPEIVRAAAALELLHTFAIVHDDVMDGSAVRRGMPSSHRAFADAALASRERGDPESFGRSAAILAGDLALVLADRLLAESGFAPDVLADATRRFDRMRVQAIAGQYLDLLAARSGLAGEEQVRRVARLKSGGYTVRYPLAIGADLARASPGVHAALEAYGLPLGEAFQLRDDVLGVFGDPLRTGKDRDSDLREGKQTLLVVKARTRAGAADRAFLDAHLGRADIRPEDGDRLREVIRATGALDATLELIRALTDEAVTALDASLVAAPAVAALAELAELVGMRDA